MLCFGRSALWLKRGTACSLSVILPCGAGGIDQLESFDFRRREILHRNVEIFAVGEIAEFARFAGGERRKSPDLVSDKQTAQWAFAASSPRQRDVHILAEGGDIVDGKSIGVLMECSGAERKQNDNLLIPLAHKGKSSDGLSG